MRRFLTLLAPLVLLAPWPFAARAADPAVLLRAYPEQLAAIEGDTLVWRDGTRMKLGPAHPGWSLAELIRGGSILDQLAMPYPVGAPIRPPAPDDDPGRIRNRAFFDHMYGDCLLGGTAPRLARVVWMAKSWGHALEVTTVNGVDRKLAAISEELEALPAELRRYAFPSAGTYNCRAVADTGQPSMHGRGAAIDLNTKFSDYWAWRRGAGFINRMPAEIVDIFERHGFIWGGRWSHYDTMHFEYRPELLP